MLHSEKNRMLMDFALIYEEDNEIYGLLCIPEEEINGIESTRVGKIWQNCCKHLGVYENGKKLCLLSDRNV